MPNLSKRQCITLVVLGLADFFNAICISLQAPFFPREAEKKGCTATEYGLIFGIFELVIFIVSPIYGQYLNQIGPNILFNGGIFVTGTSIIIFGFLDHINDHNMFVTFAFIIRIIGAIGNAAYLIASFAIIAKEFPSSIATTFASLETCFGVGLIIGPMIGGILYSLGGYILPFAVLGSLLFLIAIFTVFCLPKHPKENNDGLDDNKIPSMIKILQIPSIMLSSICILITSASIGFLATLEPHLRPFNLSPVMIGMLFVVSGGTYASTAPLWGIISDKYINPKYASLVGTILVATGFIFIGPVWFIPIDTKLIYVIIGLVLHGIGISALLVSTFTDSFHYAIKNGFPEGIGTYGVICGLWNSSFALGAFIGPSISGALFDLIGFRKSIFTIIIAHGMVGFLVFIFLTFDL